MQSAEFLAEYSNVLRALQRNDKAQINMLSMLAEDNRAFAEGIVGVIEQHILTCPPPAKLPALYLVDSIIKNVGEPYKTKFGERLAEVFGAVWDTTLQDKRPSLSRLYGTWSGVLPEQVLSKVAGRMVSTSNGRRAAAGQPQAVLQPMQQPMQQSMQPLQQQQQQQPILLPGGAIALPGQPMMIQAQPHPQQLLGFPQQYIGIPQPQQAYVQINGQLVPVSALQPQPQPLLQPMAAMQAPRSQHATPQHIMQAQASPALPPVSPGHWHQQQQQQQQQQPVSVVTGHGPMVRRSPGSPGAALTLDAIHGPPPPAAAGRVSQSRKSPSPLPKSAELTNSALTQLLSNLASSGALGGAKAAQAAADAASLKTTEFQPAFLKEMHPGVLKQLEETSAVMRPKFRDVEFQRNKRRTATAGAAVSRTWYMPVDTWIAGTVAADVAVAANNPFDDDEASDISDDEEAAPSVLEDPDQPCCAISGEPFEKFFDQECEGWFYRGAKRIHGEEAARYGVPDGSIVKVKCLAEAGLGSGAAAMVAAGAGREGGDEQQQQQEEALMAAAAADAPAAGQAAQGGAASSSDQQQQQGLAAEGADAGVMQQQALAAAAAVKQEVIHDEHFKAEVWQDDKQDAGLDDGDANMAAAAQHAGSKREACAVAGDQGGAQQEGLGSAAKRAKLEQEAS